MDFKPDGVSLGFRDKSVIGYVLFSFDLHGIEVFNVLEDRGEIISSALCVLIISNDNPSTP